MLLWLRHRWRELARPAASEVVDVAFQLQDGLVAALELLEEGECPQRDRDHHGEELAGAAPLEVQVPHEDEHGPEQADADGARRNPCEQRPRVQAGLRQGLAAMTTTGALCVGVGTGSGAVLHLASASKPASLSDPPASRRQSSEEPSLANASSTDWNAACAL